MSPALPVASGAAVVVALAEMGDEQVSQRDSFGKLRGNGRTVIVPLHQDLAPGTLPSILPQASRTPVECIALL